MVGEGIEHRAGGTRIDFLRGVVLRPNQVMPGSVGRDDVSGFVRGQENVEDKEVKIPDKDGELDEGIADLLEETHVYFAAIEELGEEGVGSG